MERFFKCGKPESSRSREKKRKTCARNFIAGIENFKMSDMYNAEKTEESSIKKYIDQAQNHAVRALDFLQENDFSGYRNECAATVSAMNSFMILTIKQDRKYFIPFIELLAIISVLVIAIGISLYFYIENKKKINILEEKSHREQFIASIITHIQENERSRISRDLHDTVTQDTRASLLLVHKLQGMDGLSENQRFLIQNIRVLEETNLRNIKSTIKNLTPPEIEIAKIEELLAEYVQSVKETKGIDCKFYAEKSDLYRNLSASQKLNIFRIMQESVNNSIKHAKPSEISIIAREEKDDSGRRLVFIASDDGCGIKNSSVSSRQSSEAPKDFLNETTHLGIRGMKSRAAIIGAEITIKSDGETGTLIKLTLPVKD